MSFSFGRSLQASVLKVCMREGGWATCWGRSAPLLVLPFQAGVLVELLCLVGVWSCGGREDRFPSSLSVSFAAHVFLGQTCGFWQAAVELRCPAPRSAPPPTFSSPLNGSLFRRAEGLGGPGRELRRGRGHGGQLGQSKRDGTARKVRGSAPLDKRRLVVARPQPWVASGRLIPGDLAGAAVFVCAGEFFCFFVRRLFLKWFRFREVRRKAGVLMMLFRSTGLWWCLLWVQPLVSKAAAFRTSWHDIVLCATV